MANFIGRFNNLFVGLIRNIGTVAFILMFFMVFFQVVLRYAFAISAYWTFEVALLFMIITAFLGGSLAFLEEEKGHVQIAYFLNKFPPKMKLVLQFFINLLMLAVSAIIFYGALISIPRTWGEPHAAIHWLNRGWYFSVIMIAMFLNIAFILAWSKKLFVTHVLKRGG